MMKRRAHRHVQIGCGQRQFALHICFHFDFAQNRNRRLSFDHRREQSKLLFEKRRVDDKFHNFLIEDLV
jgi:hypothetical protein